MVYSLIHSFTLKKLLTHNINKCFRQSPSCFPLQVVWRKLGDVGDVVSFNDSLDSLLEPPAIPSDSSPSPRSGPVSAMPPPASLPSQGQHNQHNQSHSFTVSHPQPQMASTPLASNLKTSVGGEGSVSGVENQKFENQKYPPAPPMSGVETMKKSMGPPPLSSLTPSSSSMPAPLSGSSAASNNVLRPSQVPNQPSHLGSNYNPPLHSRHGSESAYSRKSPYNTPDSYDFEDKMNSPHDDHHQHYHHPYHQQRREEDQDQDRLVRAYPFVKPSSQQPPPRDQKVPPSQYNPPNKTSSQQPSLSSQQYQQQPSQSEENLPPHFQSHRHRQLQQQQPPSSQHQQHPQQLYHNNQYYQSSNIAPNASSRKSPGFLDDRSNPHPQHPHPSHQHYGSRTDSSLSPTTAPPSISVPPPHQNQSNPPPHPPNHHHQQYSSHALSSSQQYPPHTVRLLDAPGSQSSHKSPVGLSTGVDSRMPLVIRDQTENNPHRQQRVPGGTQQEAIKGSNFTRKDGAMSEPNVSMPGMLYREDRGLGGVDRDRDNYVTDHHRDHSASRQMTVVRAGATVEQQHEKDRKGGSSNSSGGPLPIHTKPSLRGGQSALDVGSAPVATHSSKLSSRPDIQGYGHQHQQHPYYNNNLKKSGPPPSNSSKSNPKSSNQHQHAKGGFVVYPRGGPVSMPLPTHSLSGGDGGSGSMGLSTSGSRPMNTITSARGPGGLRGPAFQEALPSSHRPYQQQEWRQTYLDDSDTL